MSKTKIEWADEVWNPTTGCTKVSPGCKNCYAERMALRLQAMGQANYANGFNLTLHPKMLVLPLHWKKPRRIFVNSMSDMFHEGVPEEFISAVFFVMQRCPQHTFQVLTKRPERMAEFMEKWVYCDNAFPDYAALLGCGCNAGKPFGYGHFRRTGETRPPLKNLWAGTSIENQATAEERIPWLLKTPAAVRFVSAEPLLGPVDLDTEDDSLHALGCGGGPNCGCDVVGLDWVIVGGESGPGARPMDSDWVREIRDQCLSANVPFFFKQHGGVNKKQAGRLLDGRTWDEMPL